MRNSLLAIIILFSTIASGQDKSAETPKIAIKISQGETVVIKGVSIKFVEVVEDSRCPTGVDCIWAGRAKVKTSVTVNGKTEEKILIFGEVRPGEDEGTNLYSSTKFAINGLKLTPYPNAKTVGEIENYVLLVCEEKNN